MSVIVPVYQAEKYLDQCIQSICRQSYQELEILLIDDGSTDRSLEICHTHAGLDNRIHVIANPHNGVSHAVNTGISAARGKYVVFVDADDWVEPDYVAFLLRRMHLYAVDLVVTSFLRENEKKRDKIRLSCLPNGYYDMGQEDNAVLPTLVCGNKGDSRSIEVSRGGKIFKASILKQNLGWFREDVHYGEDLLLVLAYVLDCKAVFIHADTYLYHYRITPGSATMSYQPDRYFRLQTLYAHLEDICRQKSGYDFTAQFQLQKYRAVRAYIRIDVDHYRPRINAALVNAVQKKCAYYNAHKGLYPPEVAARKKTRYKSIVDYFIRKNRGVVVCFLEFAKTYISRIVRFPAKCLAEKRRIKTYSLRPEKPVVCDRDICTGCGACEAACPTLAIRMNRDAQGFLYPLKDDEICTECGLCETACPACGDLDGTEPIQVFGCKHIDDNRRLASTSGGVFPVIAQRILELGGVVYGVVLDDDGIARHTAATTMNELGPMKGSKYLQSDLSDVFVQIKRHLKKRPVLFTGTPCQVAGLKGYLQKEYENLYTVDLICLAVASPLLFHKYLDHISKKGAVTDFRFRYKIAGTAGTFVSYLQKGTRQIQPLGKNPYVWLMLIRRLGLRYCCHNCRYKTGRRTGDISLGDFWGIERVDPNFDDHAGVSLALINTKKGRALFEEINKSLQYIETDLQSSVQSSLRGLSIPMDRCEAFMADLAAHSFLYLKIKYVWTTKARQRLIRLIKKLLG